MSTPLFASVFLLDFFLNFIFKAYTEVNADGSVGTFVPVACDILGMQIRI